MPCVSIQATLDAVRSGAAEQGIVPIENSVEGAVTATLDELATGQDLVISAEVPLPVAFALLARPGTAARRRHDGRRSPAGAGPVPALAGGTPARTRRGGPPSSNAEAARQVADGELDAALAGRVRGGHVRPRGAGRRHSRSRERGDPFRRGQPAGPAARGDRVGPDLAGGLPARGPSRCPDGAPHRVRGARRQPDPHRVPAYRRRAGPVLLLHRLRGARGRRPGRRGADGPAPGLRRRQVPGQLPAARRRADPRPRAAPPTRNSRRRPPGWRGCGTAASELPVRRSG